VVIDARGFVLTAEVLVAGADALSVAVPGGKRLPARVVGSDPQDGLTLLKIDASGLQALSISGASALDSGAGVVVLAAPPFPQVAVGAVAGAHSSVFIADPSDPARRRPLNDLLALDVAAREGQLGAPLLDAAGRLAGLVVAGGPQVYAVDMSQAQPMVQQLLDSGHVSYPSLDFDYRQLSATEAADRDVPGGVVLVSAGTRAAQAGLAVGDIVVSANGTTLDPTHPLKRQLRGMSVRQTVSLVVKGTGPQRTLSLDVQLVSS
jgi:serine protease Do